MEENKDWRQSILDSINYKASPSTLTQVVNDWVKLFPELKRYKTGQKILKRFGPVVYGIELEKYFSSEYRPRVVLYSLLANEPRLGAVIDQTIRTERNIEVTVKYSQHSENYLTASRLLTEQSRVNLFGKPTIDQVIEAIFNYVKFNIQTNCYWSCRAVMQLSRLMDDKTKGDEYLEQGFDLLKQKLSTQWLETETKGLDNWKMEIKNLTADKIDVLINENIKKYRFENIPHV
jgi:hypothetical protein